jgi:hypothetical protein
MEPRKRTWKKPKYHLQGSKLKQCNFRCTEEQLQEIDRNAEGHKMDRSAFALFSMLGLKPKSKKADGNLKRHMQILDGLAHLVKITANAQNANEIRAVIKHISDTTHKAIEHDS